MKTCPNCQRTYPDDFSLCPRDGAHLTAQALGADAQLAAGLSRRFRLVRRLGKGGMGTVFLAEQIGVGNRPVALKVLNRKLLDDPDFLLRFQNEAGSTGRIHHPNVVSVYESAQGDDGTPYIAMEYLDGESLREVLKRRGALSVTEVAEILQQAARGLNAAHKLGIIHRDLKPDNIFLTHGEEGELVVKVVDFGIAKLRESSTHTLTGVVLGTPPYMSPEQASGMRSDELDARSDIYSLGVVVYEMLSGRVPFHSDTPLGFLRKHMSEDPPPFCTLAQSFSIPPAVEMAVMKALAKDRDRRYSSALDFARELTSAARPSLQVEAPGALPSTRIVPPASESGQQLPATEVVPPPRSREPPAPMPQTAMAQPQADTAAQSPFPPQPKRAAAPPATHPQGPMPVAAASLPPTGANVPQLPIAKGRPRRVKYFVVGLVVLAAIAAGIWRFSQSGPGPPLNVTNQQPNLRGPSPGAPAPAGREPGAESEASVRDAVGKWVQAFRSKDLTALADSYAPRVEKYFRQTNVSREQVRQYIESTFAGMVDIRRYEVNDIRVGILPGAYLVNGINYGRATATFRKTWDTLGTDGKSFSGEEIEQLTFTSSPEGWKIIREEELKILRVARN